MLAGLGIFTNQITQAPTIMAQAHPSDQKLQTGLFNTNLDSIQHVVMVEFVPVHTKIGTGILATFCIVVLILS